MTGNVIETHEHKGGASLKSRKRHALSDAIYVHFYERHG